MGSTLRIFSISHKANMVTKTKAFLLPYQASTVSRIKPSHPRRKATMGNQVSRIKLSPLSRKATMGTLDSSIRSPL
jgi:hypothetical protein